VGWPLCGEIDVMEFVGHDSSHIYGTIHYAKEGGDGHASSGNKIETMQPYNDFHVYALEWGNNEMKIFFDDKQYHSFKIDNAAMNNDNPFRKPFYLLLNLALGGEWGGKIDDNNLPQSFLVDYVRVYQ
jgi:beta-glucanase (GH16 family)